MWWKVSGHTAAILRICANQHRITTEKRFSIVGWVFLEIFLLRTKVFEITDPSCDIRSIFFFFKWTTTGLNSEFSFPKTDCHTKVKMPCQHYYLLRAGRGRIEDLYFSQGMWNANSLVQDLNLGCQVHFLWQ